jgi:hypothetical protein
MSTQPTESEAPSRDGLWPMPPGPPHEERHFTQNEVVRDLVIGTADGLTVPFALAAALSGAVAANPLIVTAGLAEIAAGCVAMGLGGYLAARTDAEHFAAERKREEEETEIYPDRERWEVAAILHRYGVRGDALRAAVDSICADKRRWVDFMNCCPGIGKSSRTWRPARREDQKDVGLGGWLRFCGAGEGFASRPMILGARPPRQD